MEDRRREANQKYYWKHRASILAKKRQRHLQNPAVDKKRCKRWYEENLLWKKEYDRQRYLQKKQEQLDIFVVRFDD